MEEICKYKLGDGPESLYKPESHWPTSEPTHSEGEVATQEAVNHQVRITRSLVNCLVKDPMEPKIDELIDINQFSRLMKLL